MDRRQTFTYRDDGALIKVQVKDYAVGSAPAANTVLPADAGRRAAEFGIDLLGRTITQTDYAADGTTAVYDRTQGYNAKGQVEYDNVGQNVGGQWVITNTANGYGDGAGYALGAIVTQTITGSTNASVLNSYAYYDGAQLLYMSRSDNDASPAYNRFDRDARGVLTRAAVGAPGQGTAAYWIDITNDATGQMVRRDERKATAGGQNPHQIWYRFDGQEIGTVGNDGGLEISYAQSTSDRNCG